MRFKDWALQGLIALLLTLILEQLHEVSLNTNEVSKHLAAVSSTVVELDNRQNRFAAAIGEVRTVQGAQGERFADIDVRSKTLAKRVGHLEVRVFGASLGFE